LSNIALPIVGYFSYSDQPTLHPCFEMPQ
jgi:hypothetical protein